MGVESMSSDEDVHASEVDLWPYMPASVIHWVYGYNALMAVLPGPPESHPTREEWQEQRYLIGPVLRRLADEIVNWSAEDARQHGYTLEYELALKVPNVFVPDVCFFEVPWRRSGPINWPHPPAHPSN